VHRMSPVMLGSRRVGHSLRPRPGLPACPSTTPAPRPCQRQRELLRGRLPRASAAQTLAARSPSFRPQYPNSARRHLIAPIYQPATHQSIARVMRSSSLDCPPIKTIADSRNDLPAAQTWRERRPRTGAWAATEE
jgi:hypothetical protein